jgi:hypothetical protein
VAGEGSAEASAEGGWNWKGIPPVGASMNDTPRRVGTHERLNEAVATAGQGMWLTGAFVSESIALVVRNSEVGVHLDWNPHQRRGCFVGTAHAAMGKLPLLVLILGSVVAVHAHDRLFPSLRRRARVGNNLDQAQTWAKIVCAVGDQLLNHYFHPYDPRQQTRFPVLTLKEGVIDEPPPSYLNHVRSLLKEYRLSPDCTPGQRRTMCDDEASLRLATLVADTHALYAHLHRLKPISTWRKIKNGLGHIGNRVKVAWGKFFKDDVEAIGDLDNPYVAVHQHPFANGLSQSRAWGLEANPVAVWVYDHKHEALFHNRALAEHCSSKALELLKGRRIRT